VLAEPSAPFPDGVDVHAEIDSGPGVRHASGGGQDDRGADHVPVSRSSAAGPDGQLVVFVGGQDDHVRGRDDHDLVVP
jgi:hypothetical protein